MAEPEASAAAVAAVDKTADDIVLASNLADRLTADAAAGKGVGTLVTDMGKLSDQLSLAKSDSKKAKSLVDVSSSRSGSVTGQTFGEKNITWTNAGMAMGIDFLYFLILLLVMHGFLSWTGRKFSG